MSDIIRKRFAISQGESLPKNITSLTLAKLLEQAANTDKGIIHIKQDETEFFQSYQELLAEAENILSNLLKLGLKPQSKVFLQLPRSEDFLAVFWGCILGGFIPIPITVPPDYSTDNSKANILRHGWELLGRQGRECIVVTDRSLEKAIVDFGKRKQLEDFVVVTVEDLLVAERCKEYYVPKSDELALILLTSGSTGNPKGVMLTANNLLASVYGMSQVNNLSADDITLNWMPTEHVASLVMFHLTEVYLCCQQIQVDNSIILRQPIKWLDLIDKYRASVTWSPNFGYGLVCDKIAENSEYNWDLSCLKWMGNGAEAVVGKTTRKFLKLLSSFGLTSNVVSPGYGMSETCSGIVHSQEFSLESTSDEEQFITLGSPIPGVKIRIVDEKNNLLEVGKIGLLQVKGETITCGYYGKPEINQEAFTKDGWFNTGDLGFIEAGKLTITGRKKDVIIINSVNYYNQEIESVVEEVLGVIVSYTAACGVRKQEDNTDKIAIFFCPESFDDKFLFKIINDIRKTVVDKSGVNPEYIIPLDKPEIPKTAIGKIQRQQLKQRFEAGEFDNIIIRLNSVIEQERSIHNKLPRNELENNLVAIWKDVLKLNSVGINSNFFELGGNSILLMEVLGKLQAYLNKNLSPVILFQYPTIASLSENLGKVHSRMNPTVKRKIKNQDIAVIGMACRFPGAKNIDQFWYNLTQGIESISFFTDEEIVASGIDKELTNHPDYVKASPILENIQDFDAEFFGYSPKEAELIDPQQRLLLECAWECLEDGGYDPYTYPGKIALYAGTATNTYLLNNIYPNRNHLDSKDSLETFTLTSMGGFQTTIANDKDYLTTRVSYKLNLTGASVNVQTACSTSLTTIHLACQSLISGECDMALAGGVSITVPQKVGYLYQEGMILSPDGHCRAFDANAGGTIFGSGGGVVLLKPLEAAIKDRDRVYAIIKGSAINNDGGSKVGYLAPNSEGQAKAVAEAITVSGVTSESISYIEAHGTGTILGDPIEIAGLTQAFNICRGYSRITPTTMEIPPTMGIAPKKKQYCALGSVKTNVGHLQIASGIVGFIKTVLCLYNKQLPASLHFNNPNPQIDFSNSPFYVNTSLKEWKVEDYPLRAGVNSLGIGGTNVHVILEENPPDSLQKQQNKTLRNHLFTISAKNQQALEELKQNYLSFFQKQQENIILEDVCFTSNLGRSHFKYRFAVVADSIDNLPNKLRETSPDVLNRNSDSNHKIAFLFTGQGSQYLEMGKSLYKNYAVFRNNLDKCAEILQDYLDENILDIIFADAKNSNQETRLNKINSTKYTQPILFSLEYALAKLWMSWGITPDIVLGHSLGEYVAATIANIFNLESALKLVASRSKLMAKLTNNGVMYVVFASLETVTSYIESRQETVKIAVVNSDNNIVLSGETETISKIIEQLTTAGINHKQLSVSHAFHSPLMTPIIEEFKEVAESITYNLPEIAIISNTTGSIVTSEIANANYWCNHILQPVQFLDSVKTLVDLDTNIFLECGAKPTLVNLVGDIAENSNSDYLLLPSLNPKQDDNKQILESLGQLYINGININWYNFYQDCNYCKVSLPSYPFQRKKYWIESKQGDKATREKKRQGRQKYRVNQLHPLVGERLNSPIKQIIFQSVINTDSLRFLEDHKVNNEIVFPATAYLEMMLFVGKSIFNTTSVILENVEFQKSLVVTPKEDIVLQVIVNPDNYWEIYSLSGEEWSLLCCGFTQSREVAKEGAKKLSVGFDVFSNFSEIFYQGCKRRGICYGDSFRGLSDVGINNNTFWGKVVVPEMLKLETSKYCFHPALFDACFQVIFAALPESIADITYIPVGIESLCFYEKHQNSDLWSRVKLREFSEDSPFIIIADVDIYDSDGNIIVTVFGVTVQKVNSKIKSSLPAWHDWLYEIVWQEKLVDIQDKSVVSNECYLVVTSNSDLGNKIVSEFQHQNQKCALVCLGEGYQTIDDYNYTINRDFAEEYNIVYQEIINIFSPDKVIYLAESNNNSLDGDELAQNCLLSEVVTKQCSELLFLIQTLIQNQTTKTPHIYIVTSNYPNSPVSLSALWGMVKTIALEYPEFNCTCIDYDVLETSIPLLLTDISNPSDENQIIYRDGKRQVARLARKREANLPQKLIIKERGTLEKLQWETITPQTPKPGEVTIQVMVTGLNFRDVLNVLNMYPGEAGELGLECSGVITALGAQGLRPNFKVGDRVIAIAPGSFSSYVTVDANLVIPYPSSLSFAEAATIPTAFLTAYYCLHHLAAIKPGDKVLIHSAAGGVGLAAVQICQQVGAEIFATASPNKWEYLKSLGINHIMNSRNLDFAEEILSITQGEGIDIVLNSFTGEYIPKSLSVLKTQGCFIEIGKNDVWDKNKVGEIKPHIIYHATDLFAITQQQPQLIKNLLSQLIPLFENKTFQPLNYKTFPDSEVIAAFRYMQQAKHIGKIVILKDAINRDITISSEGSYLITGGLGALGLEVAKWLVSKGAKHLLLIGRSQPLDKARKTIKQLETSGATIQIIQGDISNIETVKNIISPQSPQSPQTPSSQIKGIIHAAGIIQDKAILNQTPEDFQAVINPKIQGVWNLHQATKDIPLDFFIMFSSAASILGSPGQINYSAANAFLDNFAYYRNSLGLRSFTINWGAWSEIGLAATNLPQNSGIKSISPEKGIEILDYLLSSASPQIGVLPINWQKWKNKTAFYEYFQQVPIARDLQKSIDKLPSNRDELTEYLIKEVAKILGLNDHKKIDLDMGFTDMGLDSLSSLELRNRIQSVFDCKLPSTLTYDFPTINFLVDYLLGELNINNFNKEDDRLIVKNPIENELIDHISEQEAERLLLLELENIADRLSDKNS
ncbi:MAG: SDR family NAD(P)-dependent oxidoreductase [Xenococcaceae cyanobacterium MO_188.B19]|nr:SDR family NAD(P)-dependent oxidoreductase [Xenococcaceae cyanobacterium MO_188.B19]